MRTLFTLLLSVLFLYSGAQSYKAGSEVDIQWKSSWYAGKVKAVKDGRYLISYDGYGEGWDEWVTADRLRARAGKSAAPSSNPSKAPTPKPPAPKPPTSKAPLHVPMGNYSVFQWDGRMYGYQTRFQLSKDGTYIQGGSLKGRYTYDPKTKLLRFSSGPYKGFIGLYYTSGGNNSRNEPMIALSFDGKVPDPNKATGGTLQYAYFRESE